MSLVQISLEKGRIDRVPEGEQPVIELHLEPHQRVVTLELWEMPWDGKRTTRDWIWKAAIESRL